MRTGNGRRVIAAAGVVITGVLASCGSAGTPSATTGAPATSPTPQATSSVSVSSTTTTTTSDIRALDPFYFPEADTPLKQANSQLQGLWAPYKTSIIPSRHTLDTMSVPRRVANLTVGAIDDATAQSFLDAEYRDNTFVAWAEKNVQPDFLNKLQSDIFSGAPPIVAVRAGKAVDDPACDLYPVNPAVVVLDQATKEYLTNVKHFKLLGPYAIVQTYQGPCDVTYASPAPPQATPLGSISAAGETDVIAGHLLHDPVLGDIWFADASYGCTAPDAPKQICLAARA